MDCSSCREVVSAMLDGEAAPTEAATAEHHLATCAACRHHREALAALHRQVRVASAEPVPDLTAAILARAPRPSAPATGGDRVVWRAGLALVGLTQVLAALAHLGGDHLTRDQAAWEAALAVGLLWAAWRPSRATGLVPVTAVLTFLLLVNGGLAAGEGGTHHLLAPLGLGLLIAATRGHRRPTGAVTA